MLGPQLCLDKSIKHCQNDYKYLQVHACERSFLHMKNSDFPNDSDRRSFVVMVY